MKKSKNLDVLLFPPFRRNVRVQFHFQNNKANLSNFICLFFIGLLLDEFSSSIQRKEAVEAVIGAMKHLEKSAAVQEIGAKAMWNFAQNLETYFDSHFACDKGIEVLLRAAKNFPQHQKIAESSCLALSLICREGSSFSNFIFNFVLTAICSQL
jgi:hypothetical protein